MRRPDKIAAAIACIALGSAAAGARADTIADWTFESSAPVSAGPFAADAGSGAAMGFHSGASTYSSPAGNGSSHSFSSTNWLAGDYYQFTVSTLGFSNLSLSWDQTSSNTGPKDFELEYSTNGGASFSGVESYAVLPNGTGNPAWNQNTSSAAYSFSQDLSSLAALNNQASILFRVIDIGTDAANGGTVASGGTDRVDNFMVSGTAAAPVPLPAALWLLCGGLLSMGRFVRRRAAQV
jgi:hypothetical protein